MPLAPLSLAPRPLPDRSIDREVGGGGAFGRALLLFVIIAYYWVSLAPFQDLSLASSADPWAGNSNLVNQAVAKLADGKSVFYLNVNDKLADAQGNLFEGMTGDRLHLSVQGYQVWAEGLRPFLTKFLGRPASTDHAPPPTGDPSLARQ